MQQELREALSFSIGQVRRNIPELDGFPERCEGGSWVQVGPQNPPRNHWVDGFWVGLIWLAFAHTDDLTLAEAAEDWAGRLTWLRQSTDTHDLGFVFGLSHLLGARATGQRALLADAVVAGDSLLRRYNPRGEYLQAWGAIDGPTEDRGRTNIDVMMNLALLFWCSAETGDVRYARAAARHARTTRLALVRPDGSTAQVGDFDPERGVFLGQATHQGLSGTSCWSRGQGWALYGFANAYRRTGDPLFLHTARLVATYALEHAPADEVPFWDYDSSITADTPRDSSAAAVLAAGLLELAACEHELADVRRWRSAAETLTLALWRHYSTRETGEPCILLHGSRSVPHGMADHGLIYGDFYFVEALTRLLRPDLADRLWPAPRPLSIT